MNTAKIYQDSEGNECSIMQMVAREPYWAAHRIQEGEKAIEALEVLRRENAEKDKRIADLESRVEETLDVARSALRWIDAVPAETELPAMPGFDRDWAMNVLDAATHGASERLRDKHYRECAEIANSIRAPKSVGRDKGRHHEAGAQAAAKAILQKLEER